MTSTHGKSRQSMMFNTAAFVIAVIYTLSATGYNMLFSFGFGAIITMIALGVGSYLFFGAWKAFSALNYSSAFTKGLWSWLLMAIVAILKWFI